MLNGYENNKIYTKIIVGNNYGSFETAVADFVNDPSRVIVDSKYSFSPSCNYDDTREMFLFYYNINEANNE